MALRYECSRVGCAGRLYYVDGMTYKCAVCGEKHESPLALVGMTTGRLATVCGLPNGAPAQEAPKKPRGRPRKKKAADKPVD